MGSVPRPVCVAGRWKVARETPHGSIRIAPSSNCAPTPQETRLWTIDETSHHRKPLLRREAQSFTPFCFNRRRVLLGRLRRRKRFGSSVRLADRGTGTRNGGSGGSGGTDNRQHVRRPLCRRRLLGRLRRRKRFRPSVRLAGRGTGTRNGGAAEVAERTTDDMTAAPLSPPVGPFETAQEVQAKRATRWPWDWRAAEVAERTDD